MTLNTWGRLSFYHVSKLSLAKPTVDRYHSTSIHILDDDSLLNIFHLYRPVLIDEEKDGEIDILVGGEWKRERWWYKLVQVCRRWRYLMLGSASHLDLCLLCTYGTSVADMLAHSPPLPLIIDHFDKSHDVTTEDEEDILLALQHRDRVRRIRLHMPVTNLRKFLIAIDGEFPMLESLFLWNPTNDNTSLILPKTFQAPHLQRLILEDIVYPIGSPLITTAVGLVTLILSIPPSPYISPYQFLLWLSLLPQLETLGIGSFPHIPTHDVERQLLHMPITTHVTLPNLRWLVFSGVSAYLEAFLPHITTPHLERFQIEFFNQPTISIPHLQQFMTTTKKFRFNCAKIAFSEAGVSVWMQPREWRGLELFSMLMDCRRLDQQVASLAQISNALRTALSAVEYLTLMYSRSSISSEWHNEADRTQWRELLSPFTNVTTLTVPANLIGQLSRSLQSNDGEAPMVLLPELKVLSYPASDDTNDAFAAFIDARQNAGHPVAVVHL
jgi:hypothetical protein